MYLYSHFTGSRTAIMKFQKVVAELTLFEDNIMITSLTLGNNTSVVYLIDDDDFASTIAVNIEDACELIDDAAKFTVKLYEEEDSLNLSLLLRGEEE
jgi:hypothetical protein